MIDLTHEDRIRRDAEAVQVRWEAEPRWNGIQRPYTAQT
jgi:isocitrate lyase